ncbi:hypothetical protein [Paenibacillus hamazuiensis]|uniref:hypothetical protein n=1 Tax=Paenibacillus hamazuiensis TaxID=2936508 RepID=UPI00200F768D|nr:hypothetical protein [Paenibacillus hamazuiensis]
MSPTCRIEDRIAEGALVNSKVTLGQAGYTLLHSNNPEYLGGQQLKQQAVADNGFYLYQDVSPGRTRVFFYHYNNTSAPVIMRVRVRNPNASAVYLYLNRTGHAVHSTSIFAGTRAWDAWLTNHPRGRDMYKATLHPGEPFVLLETGAVGVDQTAAGIVDFVAHNDRSDPMPIEVTVYAFWKKAAPVLEATQPDPYYQILPDRPDADPCFKGQRVGYGEYCFEAQVRGTFPSCSRTAYIPWSTAAGTEYVELFNRHSNPRALAGEFEPGIDRTTGNTVYVANYGVDYTLHYLLTDEAGAGAARAFMQNPYDSGQYFIFSDDSTTRYCGPVSSDQSWGFKYLKLDASRVYPLWTTIPGGFGGKLQIVWKT